MRSRRRLLTWAGIAAGAAVGLAAGFVGALLRPDPPADRSVVTGDQG